MPFEVKLFAVGIIALLVLGLVVFVYLSKSSTNDAKDAGVPGAGSASTKPVESKTKVA